MAIIIRFDLGYSLKNNFTGLGPDFRTGEFSSLDRYKIEFMMLLVLVLNLCSILRQRCNSMVRLEMMDIITGSDPHYIY